MAKTPIDLDNLPKGIEVRQHKNGSTSVRIFFMYRGIRCRETLEHLTATKSHLKFAANRRAAILDAIARGVFDYAKEFPHSKRVKKLKLGASGDVHIKDLLNKYLARIEKQKEYSTKRGYKYSVKNHLIPALGDRQIKDLKPAHVTEMIENMVEWDKKAEQFVHLKAKTVKNHLIPLNDILKDALANRMIEENPMKYIFLDRILPAESFESGYVIKPFSQAEVQKIIHSLDQPRTLAEKNMVQFWFFTGLRPSEIMALEWDNVDLNRKTIHIDRAVVLKRLKKPKTKAGIRDVMLLPPALAALEAQKRHTYGKRDQVFVNPHAGNPWIEDQQIWRWWKRVLQRANVAYRNVYQCRHTYASTMLSNGENMLWVATQMGHKDTEMIIRVYAQWIPNSSEITGYKCMNDWSKFLA
jgi:integrase